MNAKSLLKTFLRDISQKNKLDEALEIYLRDTEPFKEMQKVDEIPFSSERKYSACIYIDTTLILGAPETLLSPENRVMKTVQEYTDESYRVVVFGETKGKFNEKKDDIKKKFHPLLIISLDDPIREETPETLRKLTEENIQYRIISGDSPHTVAAVAKKIDKNYPANIISGEDLDKLSGATLEKAILEHNIFARIKPHQKQLIIRTLKKNKLFTIMIGDGVNDILALKESDLSVAMNGGSSMAKDVSDVVLINNSFSTLPVLLYEGRRIITNIQTIANIYLMKNVSSIAAILMLGFIGLRFPFTPKHIELSSFLVIGIPSFILAFEKHSFSTTDDGFLKRLLLFSGAVGFGNAIFYTILYIYYDITSSILFYSQTMILTAVVFLGINNIILIYLQHYSIGQILRRKIVVWLLLGMLGIFLLCIMIPEIRIFFEIQKISSLDLLLSFCFCAMGSMMIFAALQKLRLLQPEKAIVKEMIEEK